MVGTPSNTVTPSLAMMSSAPEGSKRDIRVTVDPAWMAALRQQVWPKAWKNGRHPRITSAVSSPSRVVAMTWALRLRLKWVSSAPFGWPVVPEV